MLYYDELPAGVKAQPAFLIHHLYCIASHKVTDGELKKYNVDFREYLILLILAHSPEGVPQHFIGAFLCIQASGITILLDRLEDRGLIVRKRNPKNKREYLSSLSPAGVEMTDKIEKVAKNRRKYYKSIMPNGSYDHFIKSSLALIEALKKNVF